MIGSWTSVGYFWLGLGLGLGLLRLGLGLVGASFLFSHFLFVLYSSSVLRKEPVSRFRNDRILLLNDRSSAFVCLLKPALSLLVSSEVSVSNLRLGLGLK
jgi:hypothetical protein